MNLRDQTFLPDDRLEARALSKPRPEAEDFRDRGQSFQVLRCLAQDRTVVRSSVQRNPVLLWHGCGPRARAISRCPIQWVAVALCTPT